MSERSKIESYLIDMQVSYEEIGQDMWLINDADKGLEQIVAAVTDNLVVVRTVLMKVPVTNREQFFQLLLELNAKDMVHGAYALEDDNVVIIDTLEYGTMDFEEFQASLDALSIAMISHYKLLTAYRTNQGE